MFHDAKPNACKSEREREKDRQTEKVNDAKRKHKIPAAFFFFSSLLHEQTTLVPVRQRAFLRLKFNDNSLYLKQFVNKENCLFSLFFSVLAGNPDFLKWVLLKYLKKIWKNDKEN